MLTEKDATNKWCPLAKVAHGAHDLDDEPTAMAGVNRGGGYDAIEANCQCLASGCMAWRKGGQVGIGPNGEIRDRDLDGRTQWVDVGYCGAFGRPEK